MGAPSRPVSGIFVSRKKQPPAREGGVTGRGMMEQPSLTAAWRETHQAVLIYACVSLEVPLRQCTPSALQVIISEHSLLSVSWSGVAGSGQAAAG